MSRDSKVHADLVRWAFAVDPDRRSEIEAHLHDHGADVLIRGEDQLVVSWEEPERDMEEVIEVFWEINGGPCEVTVEPFHRGGLYTLESDEETARAAA